VVKARTLVKPVVKAKRGRPARSEKGGRPRGRPRLAKVNRKTESTNKNKAKEDSSSDSSSSSSNDSKSRSNNKNTKTKSDNESMKSGSSK
jgi:hypothetical protein